MGRLGDMVIGGTVVAVLGGSGLFAAGWLGPRPALAAMEQFAADQRAALDDHRGAPLISAQELEELNVELGVQTKIVEELRATVATLEAEQLAAGGDREKVAEITTRMQSALDQAAEAERTVQTLNQRLDEADKENKKLAYANDELSAHNKELSETLDRTRATLTQSQSLTQTLSVKIRETTAKLQTTSTALETTRADLTVVSAKNAELKAKVDEQEAAKQRAEEQRRLNRERIARWSREMGI